MRSSLDRWWLLPLVILAGSALVALGIVILGPYFLAGSTIESNQSASSEAVETSEAEPVETSEEAGETAETNKTTNTHEVHCTDPSQNDYACIQKRYQDLVHTSGVEAAFAQLRSEMASNEFVRTNCHQMTHVIGRTAAEVYGDIPGTYSQVDTALASFCGSGYYHGAMETIVAELGRDSLLEEANTLCADLGGQPKYSFFHYNCAHGLGHGFMGVQENELFESLEACDTLTDSWERNRCYGGVFMENVITKNNPGHPSKYLKADKPLYPCDVVEDRHKDDCYQRQSSYALETRGNDFAEVFDLCTTVEDGFRPSCYQGLGWDASVQSLKQGAGDAEVNEFTSSLCMLGGDQEARSNCVVGAVDYFIRDSYDTAKARSFCESLGANLRVACLQEVEEYYETLQSPLERRTPS